MVLWDAVAYQLRHVLRLRKGKLITVLDNSGQEYTVALTHLGRENIQGEIRERKSSLGEPKVEITLYQGWLKNSKLELVLQKGTEVGIAGFVPLLCQRSLRGRAPSPGKFQRWERIIQEAAEQARRGRLPTLHQPLTFEEACRQAKGLSLLAWEEKATGAADTASAGLRPLLESPLARQEKYFSLFIGPEGGFTADEVELARRQGIQAVSLGRRLLRAETAGLVAATAIFYALGEMG